MTPRECLTPKEIQVAMLVWEGLTNREIGKILGTSEQVIKNHLRSTFDKLGVWSRLELAMYVAGHGGKNWLSEPEPSGVIPSQAAASQGSSDIGAVVLCCFEKECRVSPSALAFRSDEKRMRMLGCRFRGKSGADSAKGFTSAARSCRRKPG